MCAIAEGCEIVQRSDYAALAGVPVALIPLAVALIPLGGYAAIPSLARHGEGARTATAFLSLAGLGFSGWLTYVEVAVIEAICVWCVGSALCMLALAALSVVRMR